MRFIGSKMNINLANEASSPWTLGPIRYKKCPINAKYCADLRIAAAMVEV